jgi:hypothetical protein
VHIYSVYPDRLDPHQSDHLDPDPHPHEIDQLDPDPHRFGDVKPKYTEYSIF